MLLSVEIRSNDAFNYDLNIIANARGLVGQNAFLSSLLSDSNNLSQQSKFRNYRLEAKSNSGDGQAFYADHHIQALVTAIQTKGYGRVLAKPKILVNDNEKGTISTTDTRYVADRSVIIGTTGF